MLFIGFGLFAQSNESDNSRSAEDVKVSIFPNPAVDIVNFKTNNDNLAKVIVFNVAGRKIRQVELNGSRSINVADLPKGMYLLQLTDSRDGLITTIRLSKK